ncbi:recQ family helicase MusN [Rhodotorula toruloides]|uniref:RecQ family helicase MusN n=1 Tax=Rhodotorula toruloides TaxID=5286 RepID=A0A511KCI3_RHOTO|nr:recQ family helicase MusN [Rhodotorula toruloides]
MLLVDGGDVSEHLLKPPQIVERPDLPTLVAANILSLGGDTDWDSRPPGIDPRRVDIPDLHCRSVIQVAEWSKERAEFTVLTNESVPGFLDSGRSDFAKVRWMHVNGLSWDVIKPLALHFNLHPLSLEDMLHSSSSASTRSKVDYYRQHLFSRVVVHRTLDQQPKADLDAPEETLGISRSTTKALKGGAKERGPQLREQFGFHHHQRDEEAIVDSVTQSRIGSHASGSASPNEVAQIIASTGTQTPLMTVHPKAYSQYRTNLREAFKGVKRSREEGYRTLSHNRAGLATKWHGLTNKSRRRRKEEAQRAAARWTVATLTKDVKVHIHVEQLSIFLFRDGTILSFSQDSGYHHQISQIFERIQSRDDLLRDSEDASFVLQALLDVTADDALEIVDEFRETLTMLESRVLARPDLGDVRHLHILSSQLLLLKSTFTPLQLLLQAIRSQDDAKAAAAFRIEALAGPSATANQGPGEEKDGEGEKGREREKERVGERAARKGFVSHEAKVYLGDVMDHVDSVLSSLDLFSDLAENLIAFTFNNLSYSSNAYMQALSVVSIIFVPATFLSSYFGMNFSQGSFISDLDKGVRLFWAIALPVTFVTVFLFGWGYLVEIASRAHRDILRMYHQVEIRRSRRRKEKEL